VSTKLAAFFVVMRKTMDNLFLGRDKIPEKKAKEKNEALEMVELTVSGVAILHLGLAYL
jgi:hypothetical protein